MFSMYFRVSKKCHSSRQMEMKFEVLQYIPLEFVRFPDRKVVYTRFNVKTYIIRYDSNTHAIFTMQLELKCMAELYPLIEVTE